jgi:serine/threonine-protein kinase HipA
MTRTFAVLLGDQPVGYLAEALDGRITFRTTEEYRKLADRPVLSQSFEDDLDREYRGRRGQLPPFFANLVPEPGPLRDLLQASFRLPPGDDLSLLSATGGDLPGAVEIHPDDGTIAVPEPEDAPEHHDENGRGDGPGGEPGLRFSLAGVQMKFSVLRDPEKIALAAHSDRGDWIVKFDSARFPNVVENEFAVMEWARASGFDVPECHLQSASMLSGRLRGHAPPGSNVYVIRRYDRPVGGRVHQEDFAQVAGLGPQHKYHHLRYEQIAFLAGRIIGDGAFDEFVRRLAFTIASGNADAHLKNWSLVYPDGRTPAWAPLYDQVGTVAWPEVRSELALKMAGTKDWFRIDLAHFGRLAELASMDAKGTVSLVGESVEGFFAAWRTLAARDILPRAHVTALQEHWRRVPLLRPYVRTSGT